MTVSASKNLNPPVDSSEIDRALARLVFRLSKGDELLARTAALVSRERGLGHVCVHLLDHAEAPAELQSETDEPEDQRVPGGRFRWPELGEWRSRLLASDLVGSSLVADRNEARLAPLVLDPADRLYLSRYFHAERRLASAISARAGLVCHQPLSAEVESLLSALFPPESPATADQARAARTALRGGLTLVSGGPGTGKTTTVTRLLLLLLAANPELRIALAAPTGKAAARLGESISEGLDRLQAEPEAAAALTEVFPHVLAKVPRDARTLHRLLGYSPRRDRFRHRAERPLPLEVVVVDEASMVDLLLMNALVDALPSGASLVLLGDRDQLASVEAGFVFGDLATAAGLGQGPGPEGGLDGDAPAPLRGCGVELRHSWRFAARAGIGDLAAAVRAGDTEQALRVLGDESQDDVHLRPHPADTETLLRPLAEPLEAYLAASDAASALERLAEFRILCATRVGPWGTERINQLVERRLAERGLATSDRFYGRRPMLVLQNDYQNGLFNGDLGICWQDGDRMRAVFPGAGGASPRHLPLAKLPRHETAWAMTVHKSQGSEFDRVLFLLPEDADAAGGILSRELVYTGLTRARRRVDLVASPEVLRQALGRSSRRRSGLVDALRRLEPG